MRAKIANNFHTVNATFQFPLFCPGIAWKLENSNGDGDFDPEIIPLLKALNTSSWHTVASCAGHTLEEVQKEHKGFMVLEPYRISLFIHVKNDSIPTFATLIELWDEASDERLWCELGFRSDDYSNRTEKGYTPFEIIVHGETEVMRDELLRRYVEIFSLFQ